VSSLGWDDYLRRALAQAIFTQDDDGSWSVEIPVLPGCVTWGQTRAEAAEMAEDAIHGWLVTSLRFGDPIPAIV